MNSHLFPENQSIEAIFAPGNLDGDCSRISELMAPVANAIDQALIDVRPADAVDLFLQLVSTLCATISWQMSTGTGLMTVMTRDMWRTAAGRELWSAWGGF